MTELAIKYVSSPLNGFWKGVQRWTEVVGYSRAASYLALHGYHEEAKECMLQIAKLRS